MPRSKAEKQRSDIRYKLFSLKSEAERGVEIPALPEGFRESFEEQEAFRGFINFGVTWDVSENDPWKVIPLDRSHLEVWNEVLRSKVPIIGPDGKVYTPEEWDAHIESLKAEENDEVH